MWSYFETYFETEAGLLFFPSRATGAFKKTLIVFKIDRAIEQNVNSFPDAKEYKSIAKYQYSTFQEDCFVFNYRPMSN